MALLSIKQIEDKSQSKNAAINITKETTLGRGPDNDIPVNSENASRHHCLISLGKDKNVFVTDLNSRNGTYINDEKITKIQVHLNDVLQVGSKKFKFFPVQKSGPEKPRPDRRKGVSGVAKKATVVERRNLGTFETFEVKSLISDELVREKIESIVIKSIGQNPKEVKCPVNSIYTIGRLKFSDIFIDSKAVSRTHAKIDVRENRVVVTDSDSTNGTYVNDEKIKSVELHDGDTISVGGEKFEVSFVMSSGKGFTSYKKIKNFSTIDLLKEQDGISDMYKDEYGEGVLHEVERQTLLFCREFEGQLKSPNNKSSRQGTIAKMVQLLSNSMWTFDGNTLERLAGKSKEKEEINPNYLKRAQDILKNGAGPKIVYFEETDANMPKRALMNGLTLDLNGKLKILAFGIPYDNLLYLTISSSSLVGHLNLGGDK